MRRPTVTLVLLLVLACAGSTHASEVTPIVSSAQLSRVHEVVPLDSAGGRIAVIASYGGETLRDAVFSMNADGSGMTRVDDGRGTFDFDGLRASADGTRIVWSGISGQLGIATATETGWRVSWPRRQLSGYALGRDGTVFTSNWQSSLRQMRPGKDAFENVPSVGLRIARGGRVRRGLTLSARASSYGSCVRIQRPGGSSFMIGLGLVDGPRRVMRFRTTGAGFTALPAELESEGRPIVVPSRTPPCRVSDDGGTVATLADVGDRRYVVVRHGERVRTIRVPRRVNVLGPISPSGRYLFVANSGEGGAATYGVGEFDPWMSSSVTLVDTRTRRFRVVTAVEQYARRSPRLSTPGVNGRIIWSERESFAAMSLTPQGTLVVSTRGTADAFVPSPPSPPGYEWSGTQAAPIGFSLDERRVVFTMEDFDAEVTGVHPYSAPVGGGPATPLLSDSMRSFGRVLVSPDRRSAWLASSTSCRETYPVALFRVSLDGLFETSFTAPAATAAP